jgi:hypothetical protein
VIELKTKQNEANVRQGVQNLRFKDILLNKHSSESSRRNSVISNPMENDDQQKLPEKVFLMVEE